MHGKEQSLFFGDYAKSYGDGGPVSLSQHEIVKSVSDNQNEIIRWIMALYCKDGFDLDATYSTGNFYKRIKEPWIKTDINPVGPDVIPADAQHLPIKTHSLNSIMFDPPFVAGSRADGLPGIIKTRFSFLKTIQHHLWPFYDRAISEFYRVLKVGGCLVFKCQDTIDSGKQYMTHVYVMNSAVKAGFYPKDLFILAASNRLINQVTQQHARKYHSYLWVFLKQRSPVTY